MEPKEKPPQDAQFHHAPPHLSDKEGGESRPPGFTRDFLTGCLALVAVALIGLVLVPLLILVFKVSALLIVPLGLLAIFVILTAFLGRIINMIRVRWPRR
ncbi:MAG: hypothetical protein K9L59_18250 [Desulfobacterales bacterium]|nr:hypothetical protein [Desulfobacterales bacterium]